MAKFHGVIGFIKTEETTPGVHKQVIEEYNYTGDILRDNRNWERSDKVNDDFTINNRFSVILDPFLMENIGNIRYITSMNVKWAISSIEIQRPRLILTVRGVYNG